MTEEEDKINEKKNEIAKNCEHELKKDGKKITCFKCGCRFVAVLYPRIMRPLKYPTEED